MSKQRTDWALKLTLAAGLLFFARAVKAALADEETQCTG